MALRMFQPTCPICASARYDSKDAVLEHMIDAHPDAPLASFLMTARKFPKLVFRDYVYCLRKRHGPKHYWHCEERRSRGGHIGCKGSAITYGQTADDVTSVVALTTKHNHSSSAVKVGLARAQELLYKQALETDATPLSIRQQVFASVDPEVAKMLPSDSAMSRTIHRLNRGASKAQRPKREIEFQLNESIQK